MKKRYPRSLGEQRTDRLKQAPKTLLKNSLLFMVHQSEKLKLQIRCWHSFGLTITGYVLDVKTLTDVRIIFHLNEYVKWKDFSYSMCRISKNHVSENCGNLFSISCFLFLSQLQLKDWIIAELLLKLISKSTKVTTPEIALCTQGKKKSRKHFGYSHIKRWLIEVVELFSLVYLENEVCHMKLQRTKVGELSVLQNCAGRNYIRSARKLQELRWWILPAVI